MPQRDINRQPIAAREFSDVRQNGDSAGDRYCFRQYWIKLRVIDVFKFCHFVLFYFIHAFLEYTHSFLLLFYLLFFSFLLFSFTFTFTQNINLKQINKTLNNSNLQNSPPKLQELQRNPSGIAATVLEQWRRVYPRASVTSGAWVHAPSWKNLGTTDPKWLLLLCLRRHDLQQSKTHITVDFTLFFFF